jgi:hypothetical protein
MSNLRLIGLIAGIIGLVSTFLIYRGARWNRANFVFFSLFNFFLITITINPESINFLRDLLALQEHQRGRLLALLVLSNIFLMFFGFYSKSRIENLRLQFDRLVRSMGVVAIEKASRFKDQIKPIMVVIPAYNEADNLDHLLTSMPEIIDGLEVGVLVIDDGSEDATQTVAMEHACLAVSNPINRGGGASLRLGYDILKNTTARICVTMDADCQHRPEDMGNLVRPIIEKKYDLVVGSRLLGQREKDSLVRITGVYTFGWLVSLLLGKKITDPSSGYRAFNLQIMNSIDLHEDQYHTSELIIEAVRKGIRIGERPITIMRRKYGKSKKGRNLKYALNFCRSIIKAWWR